MHHVTMPDAKPSSPAPVTTTIQWGALVGARLEELLHGIFEAMGAAELTWRAGSEHGVNAADGGRDLEAVFYNPAPDGSVDRTHYWVEAKGREKTVKKADVVDAILNVAAHPEVDILVFCTNSRFSNPTLDWVKKHQERHPRPKVRLWDRADLARLVREYPTVAARTLPEALTDADRLQLLNERFQGLGETPTTADLEYFWEHQGAVAAADDSALTVAMMAYAEQQPDLVARPWASLLPADPANDLRAIVIACTVLPILVISPLARPVDNARMVEVAAYLVLAVLHRIDLDLLERVLQDPLRFVEGLDETKDSTAWRDIFVMPIIQRLTDELKDVCADDCVRVIDEPHAFPPALVGKHYWRRFGLGDPPDNRRLTIENLEEKCVVGLGLDKHNKCPLLIEANLSRQRLAQLQEIVRFRREHPEGQYLAAMRRSP